MKYKYRLGYSFKKSLKTKELALIYVAIGKLLVEATKSPTRNIDTSV